MAPGRSSSPGKPALAARIRCATRSSRPASHADRDRDLNRPRHDPHLARPGPGDVSSPASTLSHPLRSPVMKFLLLAAALCATALVPGDEAAIAAQKPLYPLTTCPVSGEELGSGGMKPKDILQD